MKRGFKIFFWVMVILAFPLAGTANACGNAENVAFPWNVCGNAVFSVEKFGNGELYFCKYCGARAFSIKQLSAQQCKKAPRKFHVVYEGGEKKKYTCKYCGTLAFSIPQLTAQRCQKSPNDFHVPL